jgi:hypothetical protein
MAAGLIAWLQTRPRYVWYVEEGLEAAWRRVLNTASPPKGFRPEIVSLKPGDRPPASPGGLVITTRREAAGAPVTLYPRLSFTLEYGGAHVLALDPWMIFRKHMFPMLTRDRVESAAGGPGLLLVPGKDDASLRAWTARMVQQSPGVFPPEKEAWEAAEASLFQENRFRQGSAGFNWQDVWFFLLGDDPAWVYAPYSRIRELPNYQSSILEATTFPEPGDENRFGLQARILWAIPAGKAGASSKFGKTLEWLKKGETQTVIADTLKWIPASPDGKPYDPAAMSARLAWLTSSWVWEDGGL